MRLKISHFFFENFSKTSKIPPSIFLKICYRMHVKKSDRATLLHFLALWDFAKRIKFFVLKLGFLRPSTLFAIFFQTGVFCIRLFQNLFSSKPSPSMFARNESVCEHYGLLKVIGTMRLTGDLYQKNFESFRKIFFFNFLFFKRFPVQKDGFFAVSSWGRMVFETYAYPSGYFLALWNRWNFNVLSRLVLHMILLLWFSSKVRKCLRSPASPLCLKLNEHFLWSNSWTWQFYTVFWNFVINLYFITIRTWNASVLWKSRYTEMKLLFRITKLKTDCKHIKKSVR